jgi:PKD repeat protein
MKTTGRFAGIISGLVLLLFSCKKEPVSDFTFSGNDNPVPSEVTFSNNSKYANSYNWEFGDGTSSTEKKPKHTYTAGGTFNVKLTATGKHGSNSIIRAVKIEKGETQLDITITQQPVGGSQIELLSASFDGTIAGYLRPVYATAEWFFQPAAGGNPTLMSSTEYMFDSAHTTSKSTVYSAPPGYVLANNYYLKLVWTDDAGQHTLLSDKAYCY